ncbi:MAG: ankyrin repeat domain-containing protein [Armatimonadota bacterium]
MQSPMSPPIRRGMSGWTIAVMIFAFLLTVGCVFLLVKGVQRSRSEITPHKEALFLDAVSRGDIDSVKRQLDVIPALANRIVHTDIYPLSIAVLTEQPEMARLLVARGADPNKQGAATPLTGIALIGTPKMAELLIAVGANVNTKDVSSRTPLHAAASVGNKEVAALLIAHGADVNALNRRGCTPLAEAITQEKEYYKRHNGKAKAYEKSNAGKTDFYRPTKQGYQDTKKLLREHGGKE